jgi:hypothetical protein
MAKKKEPESQDEQSARFRAEVERLIAAGELTPTEADERFESLVLKTSPARENANPGK